MTKREARKRLKIARKEIREAIGIRRVELESEIEALEFIIMRA